MTNPEGSNKQMITEMMTAHEPQDTLVLIVDDVATNIQILADTLKDKHHIIFATSGSEALKMAARHEPDLILLDVMMPDIDGFAVCKQLKEDPRLQDIPVIFVTALSEVEDETKGLDLGAVDYITKPVSPPIVRARVRNHLQLKYQRDLLRRIALLDGLTGIANRRHFDDVYEREWRRAQRQGTSLSLVLADIDFFKGYNDHYGHQAGDACLRNVARGVCEQIHRPADLAARFGGEEFICMLPDTPTEGAEEVAERIREAVEALALPHAASAIAPHVTLSLGVATALEPVTTSAEALLKLADEQLYTAKKAGRNQVRTAILPAGSVTS
ncbi:diguanylate cyclase [Nitrincola alkalilacustris]|uniref:diguanylate cyclase n=1 Tax=Nitrincola alkalilacustris TaxID=1571224 RepID=UPI001F0CEC43|nr:diguanylate cyclase [Nitrincola alkalilacustris]